MMQIRRRIDFTLRSSISPPGRPPSPAHDLFVHVALWIVGDAGLEEMDPLVGVVPRLGRDDLQALLDSVDSAPCWQEALKAHAT